MCSEQSGKVEVWDSATRNLTIIHLVTQCHRTCFSVAIVMPALAEKQRTCMQRLRVPHGVN